MDFDDMIAPHPACVASLRQAARKRERDNALAVILPFSPLAWEKGLGDEGCQVTNPL